MARTRNPDQTRHRLMEAAFGEIYANGYTAASVDKILADSGVTKGALYHHFGSKKALAQAVIDGMVRTMVVETWEAPLAEADNAIDGIQGCLTTKLECMTAEQIACGCPLNNLAQELSSTDPEFREQIEGIYDYWRELIVDRLRQGQADGDVRGDANVDHAGTFIVAALAGVAGFAKSKQSAEVARISIAELCDYLETFRASS